MKKKKNIKLYGRKDVWGRKSLMDQGEKEKLKISLRLRTYGTNLTFVDDALSFGQNKRDLPLSIMRKIQNDASHKFNIQTDRSAWRTKSGIKAWFCEYWNEIKEFVVEEVSKINVDNLKDFQPAIKNLNYKDLICDKDKITLDLNQSDPDDHIENVILADDIKVKEKSRPAAESNFFYYMSIDYLLNDKDSIPPQICFY